MMGRSRDSALTGWMQGEGYELAVDLDRVRKALRDLDGERGRPQAARSQPHQGASVSPAWWLIDDDTERDLAPICSWDPPYITAEG